MRVLSVDLGTRNLAWCVLERVPDKGETWKAAPFCGVSVSIVNWNNVDVLVEAGVDCADEVNLNKTDIAQCVPWFVACIKKHAEELFTGVELALLEAQPTARVMSNDKRCISNIRTKVLSHVLQAILLERGIPVQFVSPAVKLRDAKDLMADASEYREHKKAAIILTTRAAGVMGGTWKEWWDARKGKKDDLADALLQGICAKLKSSSKPKQPRKRKASEMELDLDDVPAPPE